MRPVKRDGRERGGAPRVLLVGYNGANNTGAEARLLSIIEDIRAVLGPEAHITVPTLNEPNLRRYLSEGPKLSITPVPSIFFFSIRRLVRQHDIVMLVEGSCYMDTWTSALLWAFLWSTRQAHAMGKASLAYAVDAGELSVSNAKRVRRDASRTGLIITRTYAAAERLKALGVSAPIEVTADTAFTFEPVPSDRGFMRESWPGAGRGVAGLAVMDFNLWPVVMRPFGRKEHCYKWPYYFSRSAERCQASRQLAADWASAADRIIERYDLDIALLAMEELDAPLAGEVLGRMRHPGRARLFSSAEHNASRMTSVLRELDLLVTSRYHAGALSLAAQVPQVALGHDTRLDNFYGELGIKDDCFVDWKDPAAWRKVAGSVDRLMEDPAPMRRKLKDGHDRHLERARRNRELLREFARGNGWGTGA